MNIALSAFSLWERAKCRLNYLLPRMLVPHLGRDVRVYGFPRLSAPDRLRIGDGTTINHGVVMGARGGVTIGKNVRLSPYAVIETGYLVPNIVPREHSAKPIVIEDGVWVATGATILAGVTIGRNSVIAAGAVVSRDVPPNSLAMGVPARFTRLAIPEQAPAFPGVER
jgi:maltose O-acetyltransferase